MVDVEPRVLDRRLFKTVTFAYLHEMLVPPIYILSRTSIQSEDDVGSATGPDMFRRPAKSEVSIPTHAENAARSLVKHQRQAQYAAVEIAGRVQIVAIEEGD